MMSSRKKKSHGPSACVGTRKARGDRKDPAWAYGIDINGNAKRVGCMYCGFSNSGGINRFKHHLAGTGQNARSCIQVPDDVRISILSMVSENCRRSFQLKTSTKRKALGDRSDPGWRHGFDIDGNGKRVHCHYCKVICNGVYRFKYHLAGVGKESKKCTKVPRNVESSFRSLLLSKGKTDISDDLEIVINLDTTNEEEHRGRKRTKILPYSESDDLQSHSGWKPYTPVKSTSLQPQPMCTDLDGIDNNFHNCKTDLMGKCLPGFHNFSVSTATSNPSVPIFSTGSECTSAITTSVDNGFISVGQNKLTISNCSPSIPNGDSAPSKCTKIFRPLKDAVSSRTLSIFAPKTPNQSGKTENHTTDKLLANDSSSNTFSTQVEGNRNLGTDHQRTPQQKRKSKKHRSNVVREGQRRSQRLAKSMPEESKEIPESDYVRKLRGDKAPEITSGVVLSKCTRELRSCKTRLNFNKNSSAIEKISSCRSATNENAELLAPNENTELELPNENTGSQAASLCGEIYLKTHPSHVSVETKVTKALKKTGTSRSKKVAVQPKKMASVDDFTEYDPQKAIVLYNRVHTTLPVVSSNDPMKKHRKRAKIDICNETRNLWKLLLEENSIVGVKEQDEEKVRQLEQTRQLFQTRVHSFIDLMHKVQGNRKFIPWKGSVVDSVVGAFLTQNVTDHASSFAFMSMVAHFSNKPNEIFEPCSKEMTRLVKEHKVQKSSAVNHGSCTNVVDSDLKKGNTGKKRKTPDEKGNITKKKKIPAQMGSTGNNKKIPVDWDALRLRALEIGKIERTVDTMDTLDWEVVRRADEVEVKGTMINRGMYNVLTERIKNFLDRLVYDHGSIDLEWLRNVSPNEAKEYLLSFKGLGLKSTECVRLLILHQRAFPVDANVGRIAVRLGWVPLQPLPESLQLHLLTLYPVLDSIQHYLWQFLCKLDQPTLYELHYQLITFGKVFCTEKNPNCNACPLRGDCPYFASAFASSRLALPGPPEGKHIINTSQNQRPKQFPDETFKRLRPPEPQLTLPEIYTCQLMVQIPISVVEEPIIEVPSTPEPVLPVTDIEDFSGKIPKLRFDVQKITETLQNYMGEDDMSKALVATHNASIPMSKLKNVTRQRTEHLAYELPDNHPLLKGLDKREPNDPSPYLLV